MRWIFVLPPLALLTWACWPPPFPALEPEDAEALRLVRDYVRKKPGAREALVRSRNPRVVPALMAGETRDDLDGILHGPRSGTCCTHLSKPHEPVDAFDAALQSAILEVWDTGQVKRRGCVISVCGSSFTLERRLDDPEPGVRFAAAFRLWNLGVLGDVPKVLGLLGEHSFARYPWLEPVAERLRVELSETLLVGAVRLGDERAVAAAAFLRLKAAVDALVLGLNSPDAAWALGEIRDRRAVAPLVAALKSDNGGLAGDAAEALGKIGDPAARPALLEALDRSNVYARAEILRALGEIGDAGDIPLLERYAASTAYTGAINVRGVAERALKKLRP